MTSSSRRGERAARLVHYRLTPRLIDALYGPSAGPAQPYVDAETARRS